MEMIYFTIIAIFLYFASDWILNTIEFKIGNRLENRSMIFFAIILVLSMSTFTIGQSLYPKPDNNASQAQQPSESNTGSTAAKE